MPFFNGLVGSTRQILINVSIGLPSDNADLRSGYAALVDTGATITCISPKVVEDLRLKPEGKKPIKTPTQKTSANLYHVSFHIPITRAEGKDLKIHVHSNPDMEVTEIMQPSNYDVLLGMDVLATRSLFIAAGKFTLGY